MGPLEYWIGGIGLSIITYFLKRTMDELKEVKKESVDMAKKVAVIENDYINKHNSLNERFGDLQEAIKDLTKELKEFSKDLKKKD